VQSYFYTINQAVNPVAGMRSAFYMTDGNQNFGGIDCCYFFAVAVRDGDVAAVPESKTWALLLVGLGALVMALKKRTA
jgi:hypothetical protein